MQKGGIFNHSTGVYHARNRTVCALAQHAVGHWRRCHRGLLGHDRGDDGGRLLLRAGDDADGVLHRPRRGRGRNPFHHLRRRLMALAALAIIAFVVALPLPVVGPMLRGSMKLSGLAFVALLIVLFAQGFWDVMVVDLWDRYGCG